MTRGDARRRDAPRGRCDAYTPLSLSFSLFSLARLRARSCALALSPITLSLPTHSALLFSLPLAPSPLHALFDRRPVSLSLSLTLARSFARSPLSLSSTYLCLSRSTTCLERLCPPFGLLFPPRSWRAATRATCIACTRVCCVCVARKYVYMPDTRAEWTRVLFVAGPTENTDLSPSASSPSAPTPRAYLLLLVALVLFAEERRQSLELPQCPPSSPFLSFSLSLFLSPVCSLSRAHPRQDAFF